jgi:hypothetical protein
VQVRRLSRESICRNASSRTVTAAGAALAQTLDVSQTGQANRVACRSLQQADDHQSRDFLNHEQPEVLTTLKPGRERVTGQLRDFRSVFGGSGRESAAAVARPEKSPHRTHEVLLSAPRPIEP